VYQQPLYVLSKERTKPPKQKKKKTERRKLKKGKNKTRKQTYQNYLYIQSANFEMLFSCAVYAAVLLARA